MISFLTTKIDCYYISMYYREIKEILEIQRAKLTRKRLNDTCYELPHINVNNIWYPLFDIQLILKIKNKQLPKYAFLLNDIEGNIKYAICFPNPIEEVSVEKKDIVIFQEFIIKKQKFPLFYGIIYVNKTASLFMSLSDVSNPEKIADFIHNLRKGEKYDNNRGHQKSI